jgi:hypothetical protein
MMRRERGPRIGDGRLPPVPEVHDAGPKRDDQGHHDREPSLQAAGRADPEARAHQEAQVEPTRVDQQPFQDVRVAAQMRAAHRARLVEMRVRSFQPLASTSQQGQPARAADAPPIGIHGIASCRLLLPRASTAIWLGDVGPHIESRQIHQHLIVVIPLSVTTSSITAVSPSVAAATASKSSAAAITVSAIVVVSP